jgi:hypothetical protein
VRTIRLEAELTYDDQAMHGDDPEAQAWFLEEILLGASLTLHSYEIGDEIGAVRVTRAALAGEGDEDE